MEIDTTLPKIKRDECTIGDAVGRHEPQSDHIKGMYVSKYMLG